MKKLILASACLYLMSGCAKPGGTFTPTHIDSVYNGSYFSISYNNQDFNSREVSYNGFSQVEMLSYKTYWGDTMHKVIELHLHSSNGLYGLTRLNFYLMGDSLDVDTFHFAGPSYGYYPYWSEIGQLNPEVVFNDTNGWVDVTHNDTDFVEGTFSTSLYTSDQVYPATGSFKIYR